MLKLLFNFKTIFIIFFSMLMGKLLLGKKINKPSTAEIEKRIYNNVTKAIIDGYNIASAETETRTPSPRFTGLEDDSLD